MMEEAMENIRFKVKLFGIVVRNEIKDLALKIRIAKARRHKN